MRCPCHGTDVAAARARKVRIVVAAAEDIVVDTLDRRLEAERQETNGTCVWEMVFGAWARKAN
jgi:hypothetical protein